MAQIQRIGVVSRAGVGVSALRSAGQGPIEQLRAPPECSRESRLRFARSSRLAKLALLAAWDAIDGFVPSGKRAGGVVLGTAYGAHLSNEQFYAGLLDEGVAGASPRLFSQTLPSSASAEVSIQLGLTGPTMTFAQGVGAGLSAIALAANLVDSGRAPWMIAGAADTLGETLLAALEPSRRSKVSEGAALLLLTPDLQGEPLARVAGSAAATGVDAKARAMACALSGAELEERDLSSVWDLAGDEHLQETFGDSFAVSPLFAICLALDRRQLPALFCAADARLGSVDVLCLR